MKVKSPPDRALKLVNELIKSWEPRTGVVELYSYAEWPRTMDDKEFEDWRRRGEPHQLIFALEFNNYICFVDVGHGLYFMHDGTKWHWAGKGIFTEKACFLGDYYGYPSGALFLLAKEGDKG